MAQGVPLGESDKEITEFALHSTSMSAFVYAILESIEDNMDY